MPPDRRTLRDIRSAYRGMQRYQEQVGEWVQWFRFNQSATTSDPTYSTGPGRTWYPAVTLPVLIAEDVRADQNFDEDALYLLDHLHLIISYDAFLHTMMPDPDPFQADHVNDRVGFDGKLFDVNTFVPRGRVAASYLTISVDCQQTSQEDLDEDVLSTLFAPYTVGY
jgi:hypothetical protein